MVPELLAERPEDNRPSTMLLLGDVNFDAAGKPAGAAAPPPAPAPGRRRAGGPLEWKRLDGTRGEILSIEDTFRRAVPAGRVERLEDSGATRAALLSKASGFRYLHLATHGFFAEEKYRSALSGAEAPRGEAAPAASAALRRHPGLLSGLVLAGANKPTAEDDGVLTALELGELDLEKTELVVLSACQTGLGAVAGGEGVLGLQRALQTAGARSAVTALWKVADTATRRLMERFYQNYWTKQMGMAESLREAQRWMLSETKRGFDALEDPKETPRARPFYWAAFVLSGDWR
jgi:CHAT domain-containing protein